MEKVEAVDKYTVKFTLKEPSAWFLDTLASPMVVGMVNKETSEKFGDLKKPESFIGTGPWMLDSYRPNQGMTLVRNPNYFIPGQPHIDKIEIFVDEDNASRIASFLSGKYDLGWEFPGQINRTDWVQIKDGLKQKRPNLKVARVPRQRHEPHLDARRTRSRSATFASARRSRTRSIARASSTRCSKASARSTRRCRRRSRTGRCPSTSSARAPSTSSTTPPRPSACSPRPAIRTGSRARLCFTTYGSTVLVDAMQIVLKNLKDVGIEAKLDTKEYGAYITSCFYGKFDSMTYGPQTPFLEPDSFLYGQYFPEEPRNQSHVKDPVLADMLVRQRRTFEVPKRKELIAEIQRYLAKQQYYVSTPSSVYVCVWDGALQNYGPNIGYDYGGRLVAAWLNR